MINDKAILVGVDGSHASYKATWWAANYAKHAGLTPVSYTHLRAHET